MKKVFLFIVLIVSMSITILTFSCSEDNTTKQNVETNLRSNFLGAKSYQDLKTSFDKLDTNKKIDLWNSKLNQLLSQKLPAEHINLIEQLQLEFKKSNRNESNKLKELFIKLAQITPEKDFIVMFMDLKDYKFRGDFDKNNLKNKNELLSYLDNCDYSYSSVLARDLDDSIGPPDCNCNYSCTAQTINPAVCYSSSCKPTIDGCGPFGMSSCDGRVYICGS